ncbi:MAG: hypothetical protein HYV63_27545 [Candidatus Schekmanbacteria bacterium]|nr:hypothetical protein [Candidatus Schekmanbacteria bacterium]
MLVLTRRMKAAPETRNLCVIAVTSYAMNGDELKARQAGCDGYITKPVDARALLELAARSLARGRQEGQS